MRGLLVLAVVWVSASGCGPGVVATDSVTSAATGSSSGAPGSTGATGGQSSDAEPNGGDFAAVHDVYREGLECDLWLQDCPEGTKCMPWANDSGNSFNATKCSPVDPNPVGLYETCIVEGNRVSGVDNCEFGAMCWDVDPETNEGECIALCQGAPQDPSCDDPDAVCAAYADGLPILCHPTCDPLLQDCYDGLGCYPLLPEFICSPDASGPDDGAAGDPCEFLNACDPGLLCTGTARIVGCTGGQGCCSPVCNLADPAAGAACPGAPVERCEPWLEPDETPPGFEHVGVCALPEGA